MGRPAFGVGITFSPCRTHGNAVAFEAVGRLSQCADIPSGHPGLGILTRSRPPELVDRAVGEAGRSEKRRRRDAPCLLPPRSGLKRCRRLRVMLRTAALLLLAGLSILGPDAGRFPPDAATLQPGLLAATGPEYCRQATRSSRLRIYYATKTSESAGRTKTDAER
ncbi:hypothetical protein EZV63_30350 [Streptomyces sp. VN1]|nr:hypothetical protein EZV63_30350 [Streptomyces sp. VN1]